MKISCYIPSFLQQFSSPFYTSHKEKFWLRHLVILFIPKKMSQFTKAPIPTMQILFPHFMEDIIHLLPSHVFAIMTIFFGQVCVCVWMCISYFPLVETWYAEMLRWESEIRTRKFDSKFLMARLSGAFLLLGWSNIVLVYKAQKIFYAIGLRQLIRMLKTLKLQPDPPRLHTIKWWKKILKIIAVILPFLNLYCKTKRILVQLFVYVIKFK